MPPHRSQPPDASIPTPAAKPERRPRGTEHTRAALLQAALSEFAEKGVAGARTDEIAARAGVNKQLISYHFGGKEGLHQALVDQWQLQDDLISDPAQPLEDVVVGFLQAACQDPERVRFSIREAADADPSHTSHDPDAPDIADLRHRQEAGEISDELDPAFMLLLFSSIVLSGTTFPGETKRVLGLDPASPEYISHMSEQLRRVVRRLAASPTDR